MARWLLEGEWTGYTSAQRKIVHREIVRDFKRARRLQELRCIVYTDGTSLLLNLRELTPREKADREILGYTSLIRDAEKSGESRLMDTQTEANPNLRRFSNRLRILLGIDMSELVNAGAISSDDTASWTSFRTDPYRWFIKAGDAEQAAIWSIIERRETRAV